SIILLAGMVFKEDRSPIGVLPAPQNLHSPFSKHTLSGQYRLRWKKVKGAKAYILYHSADALITSKVIGMVVTKTLAVFSSVALPPLTAHYFWVSAVGTSGEGVLSDSCFCSNL